ncbi:MAG: flagellar biosynthesis protein FliQ [Lysobacterales bacterium]
MTPETLVDIGRNALVTTMLVASPILLVALCVGLAIGVLQAATQIQEMTLSFIPKLFAVLVTTAVMGHWMLQVLVEYMRQLILSIPSLLG